MWMIAMRERMAGVHFRAFDFNGITGPHELRELSSTMLPRDTENAQSARKRLRVNELPWV